MSCCKGNVERDVEFKVQRHKPKECPKNWKELLKVPWECDQPDHGYQCEFITLHSLISSVMYTLKVYEFFAINFLIWICIL